MLSLRIAARFLRRSPGQTALLIAGIAVGIAVQVFLGSLITSLQASLVDETIGSSSQVTIRAKEEGGAISYTEARRVAVRERPHVTLVQPVRELSAIYRRGTETAPLVIKAVDDPFAGIYALGEKLVQGTTVLRDEEVLIGKDLAGRFDLRPGDPLPVVLAGSETARLTVVAVFDLGVASVNERTAFVTPAFAQAALGFAADEYTAVETQVDDPFVSADVAAALRRSPALRGLVVTDWQAQNADLLSALRSQSVSSYMIQVFVLVAVALGIASTLAISAVQKTRQIGILKAMGLPDSRSGLIFFWQAGIIGVLGALAGVGAGLALIGAFALAGRGSDTLFPIVPQVSFVVISFVVGVAVALLSSLIPTRRTSRVDPIEVIQSQ